MTWHALVSMCTHSRLHTGTWELTPLLSLCSFVTVRQFPVVEFVEQARVHSRERVRGQVDLVEAFPVPIQQQPSGPAGDGRGVGAGGQGGQVHPLAPQALVRAQLDGEGARLQAADEVHV